MKYPVVLKADGLCGGKGVLVAKSYGEAADFADRVLEKREFGEGSGRLLIEEALEGKELSFIVLSDGRDFVPLVPTRDHKRVFDGDRGPNTGGMGAYSCDGIVSPAMEADIRGQIVEPTFTALERDGCAYRGFLYFGLMLTSSGPKVLEFNCRLGDPETQAIVARMDFDLAELLAAIAEGKLATAGFKLAPWCECLRGYGVWRLSRRLCNRKRDSWAGKSVRNTRCSRLPCGNEARGRCILHTVVVGCLGLLLSATLWTRRGETAYDAVGCIQFADCHYRRDIALAACLVANAGEA